MATIRQFEDVIAWQKARVLTKEIYKHCAHAMIMALKTKYSVPRYR